MSQDASPGIAKGLIQSAGLDELRVSVRISRSVMKDPCWRRFQARRFDCFFVLTVPMQTPKSKLISGRRSVGKWETQWRFLSHRRLFHASSNGNQAGLSDSLHRSIIPPGNPRQFIGGGYDQHVAGRPGFRHRHPCTYRCSFSFETEDSGTCSVDQNGNGT
jgi:hypothetical protein